MATLPLAMRIAETILDPIHRRAPMNVEEIAARLVREYPSAEASQPEVAEVLREESLAIGLPQAQPMA